jgi:hypothetical protein
MNINGYIEKIRRRPPAERQRIALIATGVSFALIFLIWVVSFSEMNKETAQLVEEQTMPEENVSTGQDSIENMLQNMPAADDSGSATGIDNSSEMDTSSVDANGSATDNVSSSATDGSDLNQNTIDNSLPDDTQNTPSNKSDGLDAGQTSPKGMLPPGAVIPPLPEFEL